MIIHGDNLEALKALLPEYEGKVDCIYIDPPHNTGNEGWVWNDNVNDPRIRKWLGEVVGKEGEDFSRHDKWLCMMYPRLQLLRNLLSEEGLSLSALMKSSTLISDAFVMRYLAHLTFDLELSGRNVIRVATTPWALLR